MTTLLTALPIVILIIVLLNINNDEGIPTETPHKMTKEEMDLIIKGMFPVQFNNETRTNTKIGKLFNSIKKSANCINKNSKANFYNILENQNKYN